MQTETQPNHRLQSLREMLNHERDLALARIREYQAAREDEALPPGDELDTARALADIDTHVSLAERAGQRLRAVDSALDLLEENRYGTCAQCGEEIPLKRLKIVPFAGYCVDCQERLSPRRA